MSPSRPSDKKKKNLRHLNTRKLSDSRRYCRLCSGTTPFFRRLSRASCSGSCRSDLPPSAAALGLRTAVLYASSGAAATLRNGACLRRKAGSALVTGTLVFLRSGRPTGARSQEEGGPSAAQRSSSGGGKLSRKITFDCVPFFTYELKTHTARCGQLLERFPSTNNQGLNSFPSFPPPSLTHYRGGGNCVGTIFVDIRPRKYYFR